MNTNHVFISYARKQFYFAESLMLSLQQKNITTWFDAQCLLPSSPWRQTLQEGLDSCTALVLVASRAALSSEYVCAE